MDCNEAADYWSKTEGNDGRSATLTEGSTQLVDAAYNSESPLSGSALGTMTANDSPIIGRSMDRFAANLGAIRCLGGAEEAIGNSSDEGNDMTVHSNYMRSCIRPVQYRNFHVDDTPQQADENRGSGSTTGNIAPLQMAWNEQHLSCSSGGIIEENGEEESDGDQQQQQPLQDETSVNGSRSDEAEELREPAQLPYTLSPSATPDSAKTAPAMLPTVFDRSSGIVGKGYASLSAQQRMGERESQNHERISPVVNTYERGSSASHFSAAGSIRYLMSMKEEEEYEEEEEEEEGEGEEDEDIESVEGAEWSCTAGSYGNRHTKAYSAEPDVRGSPPEELLLPEFESKRLICTITHDGSTNAAN
eukprot:GHVU01131913.1.p1 GENE.GHVU01131913.1~~GHVU01131913.1.p1  ORF type:complete len:361 (-),score=68.71 GHVU01131913.1:594-1676(-)